jgi:hypothetical protein
VSAARADVSAACACAESGPYSATCVACSWLATMTCRSLAGVAACVSQRLEPIIEGMSKEVSGQGNRGKASKSLCMVMTMFACRQPPRDRQYSFVTRKNNCNPPPGRTGSVPGGVLCLPASLGHRRYPPVEGCTIGRVMLHILQTRTQPHSCIVSNRSHCSSQYVEQEQSD